MVTSRRIRAFGQRRQASMLPPQRVLSSSRFHEAIQAAGVSILIASRQSNKVCVLTAGHTDVEVVEWSIPGPMGLYLHDSMLCIGWSEGICTLHNTGMTHDGAAIYTEIGDHRTGPVSIHDVGIDDSGQIWFLNTLYSSLCTLKPGISFKVEWTPSFTGPLGPHDYCHLNGMYFDDGRAQYFTALGVSDTPQGWRDGVLEGGVLLNSHGELIAEKLALPHSPLALDEGVLLLEAGNGRVSHVDLATMRHTVRCELPGVLRGAALHGDMLFVGSSQVRTASGAVATALSRSTKAIDSCRIMIVDPVTGTSHGHAELPMLQEISTIAVVPARGVVLETFPAQGEPFTYVIET